MAGRGRTTTAKGYADGRCRDAAEMTAVVLMKMTRSAHAEFVLVVLVVEAVRA